MNRCYRALTWALTEMPTGRAQAALTKAYNDMQQSSEADEDAVVTMLCGSVTDGLLYGNWVGHTHEECAEMARKRDARRQAKGE